jgi:hypothetical protein
MATILIATGILYIISVIGCWIMFALQSPKYLDNWTKTACRFNWWWFVPLVNTILAVMLFIISAGDLLGLILVRIGFRIEGYTNRYE